MGNVTWADFAYIIGFCTVAAILVYAVLLLRNLNESIKTVKYILRDNKDNIDAALANLPKISENTAEITDTLKNELKLVESAVSAVDDTARMTAAAAQTLKNDIFAKIGGILELLELIWRLIFKEKAPWHQKSE